MKELRKNKYFKPKILNKTQEFEVGPKANEISKGAQSRVLFNRASRSISKLLVYFASIVFFVLFEMTEQVRLMSHASIVGRANGQSYHNVDYCRTRTH
jgi:hypothetical protein